MNMTEAALIMSSHQSNHRKWIWNKLSILSVPIAETRAYTSYYYYYYHFFKLAICCHVSNHWDFEKCLLICTHKRHTFIFLHSCDCIQSSFSSSIFHAPVYCAYIFKNLFPSHHYTIFFISSNRTACIIFITPTPPPPPRNTLPIFLPNFQNRWLGSLPNKTLWSTEK